MVTWSKFGAISCTHCPFQNERAIGKLLNELKGRRLDHFFHLGDVIDAGGTASAHKNKSDAVEHSLYDEYMIAADMLRRIREALPKDCKLHLLDGNHDDNVQRKEGNRRIPKDLRTLCNPRKMAVVCEEYNQWEHTPYRFEKSGIVILGAVCFCHGWSTASEELEAIEIANICGAVPHRLIVKGHTHRPVPPTQCKRTAKVKLPWHYCNVGHMAFPDGAPDYAQRFSTDSWGAAVCFGETIVSQRSSRLGKGSWRAQLISLD